MIQQPAENSAEYLLSELQLVLNSRIHMESLIDREVQYYLTLFGAAAAVGGFVLQSGASSIVTVVALHVFILVVLIAGYRLLRRIVILSGTIAFYESQAALIRRYFVDHDNMLRRYLILQIASSEGPAHSFIPTSKQTSMRLLPYINTLLWGAAVAFILVQANWLQISPTHEAVRTLLAGALVIIALGTSALFFRHQKRFIVRYGDNTLNAVSELVQDRLKS